MLEREDLQCNGLHIVQDTELYRFTSDAVILANLVRAKRGATIADYCSGSGVIALLLSAKTRAGRIYAVEMQQEMFALLAANVASNALEDVIEPVCAPVEDVPSLIGKSCLDVVVCNPPYFRSGSGDTRGGADALARHESGEGWSGIVRSAAQALKEGGDFYFVHAASRLAEVVAATELCGMPVKEMVLVRPTEDKEPKVFVAKARKGAKRGMTLRTLTVYGKDGRYTDEVAKMYGESK